MQKKSTQYKILLFSDIVGKCFRYTIYKRTIKSIFFVSLLVLVLVSISTVIFVKRYIVAMDQLQELSSFREQTTSQRKEINFFIKKLKVFESQMARLENFDKKLRVITAIGDEKKQFFPIKGIGGPEKDKSEVKNLSGNNDNLKIISKLTKNINRISSEAEKQLLSFQNLNEFFKSQELLLASSPTLWPTRGWITSGFGYRKSPFTGLRGTHDGLDIATELNSDIISPADGIVTRSDVESGYGKILEIDHGFGIVTRYGHNSKHLVRVGDKVKRGQLVAKVGSTGLSTGPHLHYEVLVNGVPVDPFKFIID